MGAGVDAGRPRREGRGLEGREQLWEDLGGAGRGPGRGWFEKGGLGMMSRATKTQERMLWSRW